MKFFSKKVIIFILIFLGVAFLGTLILGGIASAIQSQYSFINDETFLTLAFLFIWIFIPSVTAYYFTYRKHPKDVSEELKKAFETKNAFKGVTLVLVSLAILASIIPIFGGEVKFDPYTLRSVTEEELDSLVPTLPPLHQQPLVLDFSALEAESIKPKTEIDISNWKQFEDKLVKIKFNYPETWGAPTTNFNPGESGWSYRVHFPQSGFSFGGTSPDFSEGREGNYTDFNGFSHLRERKLFWESAEVLCQSADFVTCQRSENRVLVTSGIVSCGIPVVGSGTRVLFIDRPGEQISGLAFGGSFLSEAYSSMTQALCQVDDPVSQEQFNRLIRDRRLDAESIKNLDTIDKVFETIKSI